MISAGSGRATTRASNAERQRSAPDARYGRPGTRTGPAPGSLAPARRARRARSSPRPARRSPGNRRRRWHAPARGRRPAAAASTAGRGGRAARSRPRGTGRSPSGGSNANGVPSDAASCVRLPPKTGPRASPCTKASVAPSSSPAGVLDASARKEGPFVVRIGASAQAARPRSARGSTQARNGRTRTSAARSGRCSRRSACAALANEPGRQQRQHLHAAVAAARRHDRARSPGSLRALHERRGAHGGSPAT